MFLGLMPGKLDNIIYRGFNNIKKKRPEIRMWSGTRNQECCLRHTLMFFLLNIQVGLSSREFNNQVWSSQKKSHMKTEIYNSSAYK